MRRLRGTAFDPFARSAERRTERRLIGEYESVIDEIVGHRRLRRAHRQAYRRLRHGGVWRPDRAWR
jgi:indolepyruvate ferredoxin oxidoreductase